MNEWTKRSVELANKSNYLDRVSEIYSITENEPRKVSAAFRQTVKEKFDARDDEGLVRALFGGKLFPVKDSFVPYLRKDKTALARNPETVKRIAARLYALGYPAVMEACTQPKESNRQMGAKFRRWIENGATGCAVCSTEFEALSAEGDFVYIASDEKLKAFAEAHLGYTRADKGLDLVVRKNGKYVIAEAKFITDFGGHQADQFEDAVKIFGSLRPCGETVIPIAVIDGVPYMKKTTKMYNYFQKHKEQPIFSALFLKAFLQTL